MEIIQYEPLTLATTYSWEKYYTNISPDRLAEIMQKAESVYFGISKVYVKTAHINTWQEADPEDTLIENEIVSLPPRQKAALKAGIQKYRGFNSEKIINSWIVKTMIERVKNWEEPYKWPLN